jgi:primosomal protein N' (replication factor Y)
VFVAVPIPALGLLTYRVSDDHAVPVPGARVVVPLGTRKLTGIVIGEAPPPPEDITLRDVYSVLDDAPFVPADIVTLTDWVAGYYLAGPGAALASALPPHALTGRVDAFKTIRVAALTPAGLDTAERLHVEPGCVPRADTSLPRLGLRQQDALRLLAKAPDGLTTAALADRGISAATLGRLRALGLASVRQETIERTPIGRAVTTGAIDYRERTLTAEQQAALDQLRPLAAAKAFHVALLHGVTGSGKTEVYLRLTDVVRQSGRGALMLVPEIALTPQAAEAFRARFGSSVAIQHSALSEGERHDQWHRIRRGDVDVVIGTRSAVFAPIANLGLIVVDEEHDTSYKQEETPRYHGRDVAIVRAKFNAALVVLGSATPALESYANAKANRYSLVSLDQRVLNRPLAEVRVVNMRDEMAAEGTEVVLSRALQEAMSDRLTRGEQSLILLNRRGFATAVVCRQCGTTLECPNCSVSLTVHTRGDDWRARCHYCNFTQPVPRACTRCAAPYLERVGIGTERIEADIRSRFPQARVARIDRDSVRRKGSLVDLLNRFARRDIDVLVGTQMIAKGHDFPDVTLVGVISADVGLGLADFRAAERTFQLLTQVAGRAGRGERAGLAIIQSLVPEHYGIRLACAQDYRRFYEREIEFRRQMRYPPQVAMVNVVVRGKSFAQAMDEARELADAARGGKGFVILGPAPAPLTRLRGEHRAQFFLKGTSRKGMREALQAAIARHPEIARRASIDVDPLSML